MNSYCIGSWGRKWLGAKSPTSLATRCGISGNPPWFRHRQPDTRHPANKKVIDLRQLWHYWHHSQRWHTLRVHFLSSSTFKKQNQTKTLWYKFFCNFFTYEGVQIWSGIFIVSLNWLPTRLRNAILRGLDTHVHVQGEYLEKMHNMKKVRRFTDTVW
jgi:hypothetical protein